MGGFMGFYGFYGRGYKIFIKINYFIKIFYNNTYAEVHNKKKKKKKQLWGGGEGLVLVFILLVLWFLYSGVRGGGSVRRRNTLHEVGGRQCYCHKRGLRGERIISK
jgi:hypothetical protein